MGPDPVPGLGPVFSALADPVRRQLLTTVGDRPEVTATELAAGLPISRQAVTKHLAALRQADLVSGRRQGREVRYRLERQRLEAAMAWMAAVGQAWDGRLAVLQGRLGDPAPPAGPELRGR